MDIKTSNHDDRMIFFQVSLNIEKSQNLKRDKSKALLRSIEWLKTYAQCVALFLSDIYLPINQSIYLSFFLSLFSLSLTFFLVFYLSIYLYIYLSFLFLYLAVYLSIYLVSVVRTLLWSQSSNSSGLLSPS